MKMPHQFADNVFIKEVAPVIFFFIGLDGAGYTQSIFMYLFFLEFYLHIGCFVSKSL